MAITAPICDFGWKAPSFKLPATDGKTYGLADVRGPKGTLVVFICNHCPYVKAVIGRLVREARELKSLGIATVAINANDAVTYPDDSFANMVLFAREHDMPFPYLHDESQSVARAYQAVCTPDFFGFNARDELQYRGRFDESKLDPSPNARRDLHDAMKLMAETGQGPREQIASMGCSIKWKAA